MTGHRSEPSRTSVWHLEPKPEPEMLSAWLPSSRVDDTTDTDGVRHFRKEKTNFPESGEAGAVSEHPGRVPEKGVQEGEGSERVTPELMLCGADVLPTRTERTPATFAAAATLTTERSDTRPLWISEPESKKKTPGELKV